MDNEKAWQAAIERTWVVRFPKQHLSTFGATNLAYYVVTEPVYQDFQPERKEGVIRTGRVVADRPAVVTPTYALNLQGFSSEAYEYLRHVAGKYGPNSPGVLYQYRNEADNMEIVGGTPSEIAHRISDDVEQRKENMSVVMVGGADELWDVALLKFVYEFIATSAVQNVQDLHATGLLEPQPNIGGAPRAARDRIEALFRQARLGGNREELKQELDRWGLFEHYEDRFLSLFRRS